MSEQRQQAYQELIKQILQNPQGIRELFEENQELIDDGLIDMLLLVAPIA